ncbi:MAG: SufS family cysteine desulfurase [Capsulimonadaceae bacterium]
MNADDGGYGGYPIEQIRAQFPILDEMAHGHTLVYLDNAATTQKPQNVIDTLVHYYQHDNANIHRGVHLLSERATARYEEARARIQRFLNAADTREIIFTRGTTEGINLVAQTYGRRNVGAGDEIIITAMEHHSNIVPWQMLCEEKGAVLRVVPITDDGVLDMDVYESMLGPRTKFVAVVHLSNSLGTVNPIRRIIESAHRLGIPVLVDGAQSAPHLAVDVRALDCDFFVLSGHKMYGPTGIGVLYGKAALLEAMPPYQGGGDMIASVTFEKTTYNQLPYKFEAGTPNIEGPIGLAAAIDFIEQVGIDALAAHEHALLEYGTTRLPEVAGLKIVGTAPDKAGVISFILKGVHPHDIGTLVDQDGIAIRTGHHCTQPVMKRFGIPATARASFAAYNTCAEVDALVESLNRVAEVFA